MYTDGSVTKDQSGGGGGGGGFTAKQGATTIHEGSAAYTVSTSSLTMEVEAVTHAFRWIVSRGDRRTTHAIILTYSTSLPQEVKSGMGRPDWNVSKVDIHLRKILWVYCTGYGGVKGNDREDTLAGKATFTSGLLLGRSEVLRSLRHYLQEDITLLIAWRREALKEEALEIFLERTREGHWNCFKGNVRGNF